MHAKTRPATSLALRLVAVVTVLGLSGCGTGSGQEPDPDRAAGEPTRATQQPAAPDEESGQTSASAEASTSPAPPSRAAAVYYVGDTERAGPRLYREFRRGQGDPLASGLELLATPPLDPDYRTAWRPGQLLSAAAAEDVVEVVVDPSTRARPAGMSRAEARAALQQVLYTVQAARQERVPVSFRTPDGPADRVLGVATPGPLRNGSMLRTLAHVSLTSPEQAAVLGGDTLQVSGVGNSFEATLRWELRQGDRVVDRGFVTAEGWTRDRLHPFTTSVDVSGLTPGDYTVWVTTDDPTGGTEGIGAMTDDRDVTLS